MKKRYKHPLQEEAHIREGYYGVVIKNGKHYNTNWLPFDTAEEVHDAVHWTFFPLKESAKKKYKFAYIIRVKRKVTT